MELELSLDDVLFEDILDYVNHCVQDYTGRLLTEVETAILRLTWEENLSYAAMAKRMGYAPSTLRGVYGYALWQLLSNVWPSEGKVKKSNFNRVVKRRYQDWLKSQQTVHSAPIAPLANEPSNNHLLERDTLASRLLEMMDSGYHSIILTGPAGIGKTHSLRTLQSEPGNYFTHIIEHPTHELPSWRVWHQLLFSSNQDCYQTPPSEYQLRQQVIQALNQTPYLIIVDQIERFLDEPQYNHFFNDISAAVHQQSCLLWSSDIIPIDFDQRIVTLETIEGLSFDQAQGFITEQYPNLESSISQNEEHWQQVNELCGGHPTLLHRVIDTIQSFYNNQIEQFFAHLLPLSPSLSKYFDELFGKLSDPEKVLLYWLALRPLSWLELRQWLSFLPFDESQLMEAWQMLQRRHLIRSSSESDGAQRITPRYFGLYVIDTLRETFTRELSENNLSLFHSYPIVLPQASFQQQEILHSYLLKPLAAALKRQFLQQDLPAKFDHLLGLPSAFDPSHSFAAGNLFNLAVAMGLSVANVDWRNHTLWHADLTVPGLKDIDFQTCQFRAAVLPTGLQGRLVTALHPTGRTLAIGDQQGLVQVYTWTGHRFSLDWSHDLGLPVQEIVITDGSKLIVATVEQIQIWDAIAHKETVYSAHLETVTLDSLAVSPDGQRLATGLSDSSIQLWNLTWGEPEGEPLLGANDSVKNIAFSPDGKSIAGYDNNNQIIVWHQDPETGAYGVASVPLPLNPYGNFLTFEWTDTQLRVIEAVPEVGRQGHVFKVAIRAFVVAKETLSDDSMPLDVQELTCGPVQPYYAVFSGDGSYLALCDVEHTVMVWDHATSRHKGAIQLSSPPYALNICNGGRILLCQDEHRISLWDLTQQRCVQIWDAVSDLDQYHNCKFYKEQGLSSDELMTVQRLGATVC
ncbi:AAA family ATPase [Leptolyngbya cf. ectocarpi LEGE 11479]|uniref:AAA family ATPase n=1 Tax=Leptolyngbya cf. ectocarpi LEGE 11479 TaxID=1828722 RepID=A0A928X004_LEPEC|nr:AAA family ATPase [Leptolyngbya ectocarpi]MBE9066442.1 AAA family ATPase [Leptolyngbya cf. ectocarpi LEGE 11479]